jgi:hypothetical protein
MVQILRFCPNLWRQFLLYYQAILESVDADFHFLDIRSPHVSSCFSDYESHRGKNRSMKNGQMNLSI